MEQVKENGKLVSILGFEDFEHQHSGILKNGYSYFFRVQEALIGGLYETEEIKIASPKHQHFQEEASRQWEKHLNERK